MRPVTEPRPQYSSPTSRIGFGRGDGGALEVEKISKIIPFVLHIEACTAVEGAKKGRSPW